MTEKEGVESEAIKSEYRDMSAREVIKKTRKESTESLREENDSFQTF